MSAKMYPTSNPILIENIDRSEELCAKILSYPMKEYQLIKRRLNIKWELNGPTVSDPHSITVDADDIYIARRTIKLCTTTTHTISPTPRVCSDGDAWRTNGEGGSDGST
jgi:hypothetical protein